MFLLQTISSLILLIGLVSSAGLDWLNDVDPNLQDLFKGLPDSEKYFNEAALKKKPLNGRYQDIKSFLGYAEMFMVRYYPFKVDLNKRKLIENHHEMEDFKESSSQFYNRLLYAIQWISMKIDFLNQNPKLKVFYEQDLLDLTSLKYYLERSSDRFKSHLEKIFEKIEALKSDPNDQKLILHQLENQLRNIDYKYSLDKAIETTDNMVVDKKKRNFNINSNRT